MATFSASELKGRSGGGGSGSGGGDGLPFFTISFTTVVHLVREPLKTIASRWNGGYVEAFWKLMQCNVRSTTKACNSLQPLLFWLRLRCFVRSAMRIICFHGMVTFTAPNAHNCSRKLFKTALANHHDKPLATLENLVGWTKSGIVPITGATLALTLQHWALWNLFVEAQASERLRVEDFTAEAAKELCEKRIKPWHALAASASSSSSSSSSSFQRRPSPAAAAAWSCPALAAFNASASGESTSTNHDHTYVQQQKLTTRQP